jgi:hypothetical protein
VLDRGFPAGFYANLRYRQPAADAFAGLVIVPGIRLAGLLMALVLRRTALFLFIVVIWAFIAAMVVHASASHAPKPSFPPARGPAQR